jgi:peptidoglycan hydrolase-like protein with peptidoglycan-binding domain
MQGSGSSSGSAQDSSSQGKGQKASNSQVREVQEALKAQGHDPGPIDGVMGPQTQQAIREYQRSQNLSETGRLDAQTAQKLGVGGGMSGGGSTGSGSTGSGSTGSTTGGGSGGSSQGTGSRGTGK